MSLILEALKKSEAERGERPRAPAGSVAGARSGPRGLAVGMAAIALLGALAGWWGSRHWFARAPLVPATDEAERQAVARGEPATGAELPATGPAATFPRSSAALESAPVVPPDPAIAERAGPVDSDPEAPEGDGPGPRAAPVIPSVEPPPPRLVTVTGPYDVGEGPPEPTAPAPLSAADGFPPHAGEAESASDLPRFDQLPGLREEFGRLELNMLVYAARPEARFALINLNRFEEGDQVRPGLEIREIRRDGVVLTLRGQAVLLPSSH